MCKSMFAGAAVLAMMLSGCAGIDLGEAPLTATSDNIPLRETLDVRAGMTQFVSFEAPRDDVLKFDYERVAGRIVICLMTAPNQGDYRPGDDTRCGHDAVLDAGGWRSEPATASFTNAFDGGAYVLALSCQSNDDCVVHVRVRHDDAEFTSTGDRVIGADQDLGLGERLTGDLGPERSHTYRIQADDGGRLTYDVATLTDARLRACFVTGAESERAAAGRIPHCMAQNEFYDAASWEGYLDVLPDEYGLIIDCLTTDLDGCVYQIKVRGENTTAGLVDISGDSSPAGHGATQLPHRARYQIDAERSASIVFGVPEGQRLHYSLEAARWPTTPAQTATACLAYEVDLERLEEDLPVSCEERLAIKATGYSSSRVYAAEAYADLDQDWYTVHIACTSSVPCSVVLQAYLEDAPYQDLRPEASGSSPHGHNAYPSTRTLDVTQPGATLRGFAFHLADAQRLTVSAAHLDGESTAGFCLTYEDQLDAALAGGAVTCIDTWNLKNTGYSSSRIQSFSDYNDLSADWYALVVQTGTEDMSYELSWEVS